MRPLATLRTTARLLLSFGAVALSAQSPRAAWDPAAILAAERYVRPPEVVDRIVMAPRTDIAFDAPNTDRSLFLRTTGEDRGRVSAYGAPHIYLGGVAIDERANRARDLTVSTHTGLVVVSARTGATTTLQTPAGATISGETWSPSGRQVAY
ncbi:MAG: hypothetical protein RL139_877, partial [Gemmatimonadota bacterium]